MIHYCTLYHYDMRNMFKDELPSVLMCNVICIPSVMPLLGSYIYINVCRNSHTASYCFSYFIQKRGSISEQTYAHAASFRKWISRGLMQSPASLLITHKLLVKEVDSQLHCEAVGQTKSLIKITANPCK